MTATGAPASQTWGETDAGAPSDRSDPQPANRRPSRFRRIQRGRWHSYELDGQRLPTVTGLIRDGIPKPNLIDWAARSAAEYAADHVDDIARLERDAAVDLIKTAHRRTTSAAAAKGTEIHRYAQTLAAGETVEVPEAAAGYVDAYMAFLDQWQPEIIAVEAPLVNRRWRYAGTFDLLQRLRGVGLAVVDVKTGGTGVWPETCLQIAAYRAAETYVDVDGAEQPMPATVAGYALWLSDTGSYELLPVESGPDIFAVFLHVAHVAAFMSRARDDLIGFPLEAPEASP